jgi:DNA-binding CsgD family transcriptional regulator
VLVLTMHHDDDSGVRRHAGQRPRLRAQGGQPAGAGGRDPGGRPRRGHLRPLGGQPRVGYVTGRKPTLAQPFAELTAREQGVLGLIAKGLNNAAIGQWLQLAPKTVRNLASSVFAKLQVADRAQAMRRALDEGLGQ